MIRKLMKRGIDRAASRMQWREGRDGWTYPVFDRQGRVITRRWKAYDSAATPKYRWKPAKQNARYYHAADIEQAIAAADGVLWIANGEPSVLAYHQAGIRNVLSWFGENAIPSTIVEDLQALCVATVRYPVDNDDKGIASGARLSDQLAGSGIHIEIYQLPDIVGHKGDANDLWQAVAFDPQEFRQALSSLDYAKLPAAEPKPIIVERDYSQTPSGLIDALTDRMRSEGYRGTGEWINGRSILREDRNPSGSFNTVTGVHYDHATGEGHSPIEVATALGIDWKQYYPSNEITKLSRPKPDRPPVELRIVDRAPRRQLDRRGLPDDFIRAVTLAAGGKSDIALIVSKILSLPDDEYTMNDIADRTGYTYRTIQNWIDVLLDLNVLQEVMNELNPIRKDITTKGSIRSFLIIRDRDDIAAAIVQGIENRLTEARFKNLPARPNIRMASQIGADKSTYDAWIAMFLDQLDSKEIQDLEGEIDRELNGAGDWKGWRALLYDDRHDTYAYTPETLPDTLTDWRVEVMERAIRRNPTRHNSEWQRLLGTFSKGTVYNVRKRCNLKTIENKPEITTLRQIDRDILRQPVETMRLIDNEMRKSEREHGARVIACRILTDKGVTQISAFNQKISIRKKIEEYAREGFLRGVEFTLQGASTYEPLTEDDIKQAAAAEAEEEAKPNTIPADLQEDDAPDANDGTPDRVEPVAADEQWPPVTEYRADWLRRQIAMQFEIITGASPDAGTSDIDRLNDAIACWQAHIITNYRNA